MSARSYNFADVRDYFEADVERHDVELADIEESEEYQQGISSICLGQSFEDSTQEEGYHA